MSLSNAERQRRYRQRLRAKAAGANVVEQVRITVERAVLALWAYHERPGPGGVQWSSIDGCHTLGQYRSELERSPANLLQACRAFLPGFEGLMPDEARTVADVIEIADALRLVTPTPIHILELASFPEVP